MGWWRWRHAELPTSSTTTTVSVRIGEHDANVAKASRVSNAVRKMAKAKQGRKLAKRINALHVKFNDYIDEASLVQCLQTLQNGIAPVRLLDGEWLLRRAAALREAPDAETRMRLILPRRQELERTEPEAYMSEATLLALPRGDWRIGEPLPIISVSQYVPPLLMNPRTLGATVADSKSKRSTPCRKQHMAIAAPPGR